MSAALETSPAAFEPIGRESYHRTPEELDQLELEAVAIAKEQSGQQTGVVALAAPGYNSLADFGRTYETTIFAGESYDFHAAMEPYEAQSTFLYTIDLDEGKIAHVKRVVRPRSPYERVATGLTGIEMIDDRLRSDVPEEQASVEDILAAHGIDNLDATLNIATNMVTGRATQTLSKPHTLLSYKAVFELTRVQQVTHLFAYMNQLAVRSLAKLGVEDELLGGREFHLPRTNSVTEYDDDYVAVCIPDNEVNRAAFNTFNPAKPLTKLIADKTVPLVVLQ